MSLLRRLKVLVLGPDAPRCASCGFYAPELTTGDGPFGRGAAFCANPSSERHGEWVRPTEWCDQHQAVTA